MDKSSEEVSMGDILASEEFRFIVGPDRKEFWVHREALTGISPVMQVLITGPMLEATTGVATLDDVAEEDFLGLCEYAYFGDYKSPIPSDPLRRLAIRPQGNAAQVYGDAVKPQSLADLTNVPKDSPVRRWRDKYGKTPKRQTLGSNTGGELADKDWTKNILRHAKMYIIADRYDVHGMRKLARFYLYWALNRFKDSWDSIPAIEKLVRLVYENTKEDDEMRGLISSYVALKYDNLYLHPSIQAVLRDCSEFCSDVLKSSTERFVSEMKELKRKNEELESSKAPPPKRTGNSRGMRITG